MEPVAYQVFRKEDGDLIHAACAQGQFDREFPLYAEDIEAMQKPVECVECDHLIAEADLMR